jgi:hypothetical protein
MGSPIAKRQGTGFETAPPGGWYCHLKTAIGDFSPIR